MITYPVSPYSRWAVYSISQDKILEVGKTWPREDGMPFEDDNPDRVYLLHVSTSPPAFNNATHQVFPDKAIVNVNENTLTQAWKIVPLTAEELAKKAEESARQTDISQIKAIYTALKNGTGTTAERMARVEKVLARLIKDTYGT